MLAHMMPVVAILSGFVLGFFGSMPPTGPIAVLVLQRGVVRSYREASAIALGAATAEAIYCILATFGLAALFERFPRIDWAAKIAGVLVLAVLGVHFARFRPGVERAVSDQTEAALRRRGLLVGFGIAAANPVLIITWSTSVAMLYSFGGVRFGIVDRILFAVSVGAGIFCWFRMLLVLLRRYSQRFTVQLTGRLVHGAGYMLVALAVVAAGSLAWRAGLFR